MIELDLKGAGWLSRALAAVACHRQWLSIRLGSGFTSRVSRRLGEPCGCVCGILAFSCGLFGGFIYDAVDAFVRGPNVTGPASATTSSRCEMRSKPKVPSLDCFWINVLARSESAVSL